MAQCGSGDHSPTSLCQEVSWARALVGGGAQPQGVASSLSARTQEAGPVQSAESALPPLEGKAPTWGGILPGGSVDAQPWMLGVRSLLSRASEAPPLALPLSVERGMWGQWVKRQRKRVSGAQGLWNCLSHLLPEHLDEWIPWGCWGWGWEGVKSQGKSELSTFNTSF